MRHVLKNKRKSIFSVLVKEDLFNYIKSLSSDIASVTRQRNFSVKNSYKIAQDSIQDYYLIIKAMMNGVIF
jgi:predicted RNase H-like nuclease